MIHQKIATVKINSNWAVDPDHQRIFVVGDIGRAVMYDCSMGSLDLRRGGRNIYTKKAEYSNMLVSKKWFWAHRLNKANTNYVNTVRFLSEEHMFVTATTSGEVKLWSAHEGIPMATMNSLTWDADKMINYIA